MAALSWAAMSMAGTSLNWLLFANAREYFRPSTTTSLDPVKGQARYMNLLINGQDNPDAAWYYPDPKPAARKIKGYVAFWRGVDVEQ